VWQGREVSYFKVCGQGLHFAQNRLPPRATLTVFLAFFDHGETEGNAADLCYN